MEGKHCLLLTGLSEGQRVTFAARVCCFVSVVSRPRLCCLLVFFCHTASSLSSTLSTLTMLPRHLSLVCFEEVLIHKSASASHQMWSSFSSTSKKKKEKKSSSFCLVVASARTRDARVEQTKLLFPALLDPDPAASVKVSDVLNPLDHLEVWSVVGIRNVPLSFVSPWRKVRKRTQEGKVTKLSPRMEKRQIQVRNILKKGKSLDVLEGNVYMIPILAR